MLEPSTTRLVANIIRATFWLYGIIDYDIVLNIVCNRCREILFERILLQ